MVHYYLINTLKIYDITEILLKVVLNHINLTIKYLIVLFGPHIIKWRKINMKSLLQELDCIKPTTDFSNHGDTIRIQYINLTKKKWRLLVIMYKHNKHCTIASITLG
jgi:hypothetical protein